jgi:hypothetical protein
MAIQEANEDEEEITDDDTTEEGSNHDDKDYKVSDDSYTED